MFGKLASVVAVLSGVAIAASPAAAKDYAIIARDIVPSGQYGSVPPPPQADQQAEMYNALTPLFNHVTSQDLLADFKPDYLGGAAVGPFTIETVPHPGVTIKLDPYDVPQIIGKTRDDVTWGAGWIEAQDRGTLMEEARGDAAVAAIDAPGLSALNLVAKLETFQPSAQTERVIARQTGVLKAAGADGRGALHDLRVYLQGINAYIRDNGDTLGPYAHVALFTLDDIYAFNALKDQFVGEGGGQQAANAEFLSALRQRLGVKKATEVFNDLREANDPEAPVSVPGSCPVPAAANEYLGQRAAGPQQPVGERQPCARGAARVQGARLQRVAGVGQAVGDPPPDHGCRPADRLLLPGPDARGRPRGTRGSASAA